MGTIQHHAIVITSYFNFLIPILEKAKHLKLCVSEIVEGKANDYCSFAVFPDGSKEWWTLSDCMNEAREELKKKLGQGHNYPFDWIEVSYGELGVTIEESSAQRTTRKNPESIPLDLTRLNKEQLQDLQVVIDKRLEELS